jgi:hypothetical protein
MCDPFYFDGITSTAFNKVVSELAKAGFNLNGPSGTVQGPYGIVIQYEWTDQTQSLKVVVVEKNFLISCNQIRDRLKNALASLTSNA